MIEKLPIRIRLSLGFALGMALLLAVVGLFFYGQLKSGIDRTIDRELAARLAGAIAIVRDDGDDLGDPARDPLVRVDPGGYVQVLGPDGTVVSATSESLAEEPLVDPGDIRDPGASSDSSEVPARDVPVPGIDGRLRVAAATARDDGVGYTVVAGASLEQRDEALAELRNLLWIGGPLLLLISALAGYMLAAAALRPVERMREEADRLSGEGIGERLPVSPARDELSRLGETLNAMLERIDSVMERERSFSADASHELRTPLTILRAELDLALASGRDPREMSVAIRSALEEVDRLIGLTNDLLALAKADAGEGGLLKQEVRPGEIVADVLRRLDPVIRDRGITVESAPSAASVNGDPDRLDQAVTNLVANAISHARDHVVVRVTEDDGICRIQVTDDGPGFSDSMLESGLERFARSRETGAPAGAGLGLAIADAVAAAHGGRVVIGNLPGGGAEACLEIPARSL